MDLVMFIMLLLIGLTYRHEPFGVAVLVVVAGIVAWFSYVLYKEK